MEFEAQKEGGWVHYSVTDDEELKDIVRMINIKVKPQKYVLSRNVNAYS